MPLRQVLQPQDADRLDHFDPRAAERWVSAVRKVVAPYLRASVTGLERIPPGPAMIVGNHNAGITFLEPLIFGAEYYASRGFDDPVYFLGHDSIIGMPVLGPNLVRIGGLRATPENARRVLDAGAKLLVFPGGGWEAFRPFWQRNRIDFADHQGFAALALELDVPIVPMLNRGGHRTFVVLSRGEKLAELLRADALLRTRVWPISLCLPWGLAIGPWFHLPFPVRCSVEIGEPIRPGEAVSGVPLDDRVSTLYRRVVSELQRRMDERRS